MNISNNHIPLVEEIILEAGKFSITMFNHPDLKKRLKSKIDLVTEADEKIEKKLISSLCKIDNIPFLSEEFNPDTVPDVPCWIIDPIDGTTNFASGISPFAISVAHFNGKNVDAGFCFLPVTGEMFYAIKKGGAYLNRSLVKVNNINNPFECVAATGFADITHSCTKNTLEVFNSVIKKTRALRRLGSAVADMVYTACGKFSFFYEAGLSPWDVAAGSLIVQEAGGKVTDFYGGDNYLLGRTIIASNSFMYDFIKKEIDTHY